VSSPEGAESARLFVAVWPPPSVVAALGDLGRRPDPRVRWTTIEQWHVTLRFLGTVEVAPAFTALSRLRGSPGARAALGPGVVRLGREVLAVPVEGLADLASAVDEAFDGIGRSTEHRTFRGHITLARGKDVRTGLVGGQLKRVPWTVTSVALVRSYLGRGGSRYETVASADLTPP
jgi:RNA 2',3'-cyclic 3'-phosphodiesterase